MVINPSRSEFSFLVADIGGTNTRIGFVVGSSGEWEFEKEWLVASDPARGLGELIKSNVAPEYRRGRPGLFAVAGPVRNGVSRLTNLPWEVDASSLARTLDLSELRLINDVEAMAWQLIEEEPENTVHLSGPEELTPGHRALLSLGTGLGGGGALHDGGIYRPWSGECGHATFAPRNADEWRLATAIRNDADHLSWEHLLSGAGLLRLARYYFRIAGEDIQDFLSLNQGDPAAAINRAAREDGHPACEEAMNLFVTLLGARAGDMALTTGATGGVFLGGGMAIRISWAIRSGNFRSSFISGGRMRSYLEKIPVFLLKEDRAALRGAARCAFSAFS